MTKRKRNRTPEKIASYDQQVASARLNYWFDYYDPVDSYGDADEEVDKYGRSLSTHVHIEPDYAAVSIYCTGIPRSFYSQTFCGW